jgi:hypothetical protein
MRLLFVVLFSIALFHLCLYYCNVDLYSNVPEKFRDTFLKRDTMDISETLAVSEFKELSETKEEMEKYLNELKQYDTHQVHG